MFYQSEAENPSITETPAGDAINLIDEKFIPADGVMLIAAHESRHRTFTEWIDGSVINEVEPENRDVEVDIYNAENTNVNIPRSNIPAITIGSAIFIPVNFGKLGP